MDYSYDAVNRLNNVVDNRLTPGANTTIYTYDGVGNLASYTYPNLVQTAYNYDDLNRLTSMSVVRGIALNNYIYSLGLSGNRLSVSELSGRYVSYGYDGLYRLTNETVTSDPNAAGNGAMDYVYDAVGNRLTRSSTIGVVDTAIYAYDDNDRLTSDSYDANGNTLASDGNTYVYDFENRLTDVNSGDATYVYDGDGNRVAKTAGGVTTRYLVDTLNPTGYAQVLEETVLGTVQRTYTYGLDLISENQLAGGVWTPSFYGYDGHGSVRFLTDASGNVTDTYDYDAFGNLIHSTGSTPNDYRYSGEQFDTSSGFYYLRARYLQTVTGRFLDAGCDKREYGTPVVFAPVHICRE